MNRLADIVCIPFGYVLRFFNDICGGHYILTLFLFALLVKLLMVPMSIKQQKNQIKGAMLRPKMAIIEKKYKGRTISLNIDIMFLAVIFSLALIIATNI